MSQPYPSNINANEPNTFTIDAIKRLINVVDKRCLCIAEIGVHTGATSKEIAALLNNVGELHIFDFIDKVDKVKKILNEMGYNNIISFGSSYKYLDSYNWCLMHIINKLPYPIYDYIYLDGAHSWAIDALTFFLCDKLIKVGGLIDFDDYGWTFENSPSLNPGDFPKIREMYTDEQLKQPQVALVVDLLVRRDTRYKEVIKDKVFQKVSN